MANGDGVTYDPLLEDVGVQKTSFIDALQAGFDLSDKDTTTESIKYFNSLAEANLKAEEAGEVKLSAEELNKRHPNLPKPFTENLYPSTAKIQADAQLERVRLQKMIQSGPQNSTLFQTMNFAYGMVPHIKDPVNIGVGVATAGIGTAALAGSATAARILGLGATRATAGQIFAREIAFGLVENAITEPLSIAAAESQGDEITLGDAALNVVGGAMAFPLAGFGMRQAAKGFRLAMPKSADFIKRRYPELHEKMTSLGVAQLMEGKSVDLEAVRHSITQFTDHDALHGSGYVYAKLNPENIGKTPLFAASSTPSPDIGSSSNVVPGPYRGQGVYLTDDFSMANNVSAHSYNSGNGRIFEAQYEPRNVIDLDQPFVDNVRSIVEKFMEEKGIKADTTKLGKDVYEDIIDELEINSKNPDDIDELNSRLVAAGFDGLSETIDNIDGQAIKPRNQVTVIDPAAKVNQTRKIKPDPAYLRKPTEGEIKDMIAREHAPERSFDYDAESRQRLDERLQSKLSDPIQKTEVIGERERLLSQDMENFEKMSFVDDATKKDYRNVLEAQKKAEVEEFAYRNAIPCVGSLGG